MKIGTIWMFLKIYVEMDPNLQKKTISEIIRHNQYILNTHVSIVMGGTTFTFYLTL